MKIQDALLYIKIFFLIFIVSITYTKTSLSNNLIESPFFKPKIELNKLPSIKDRVPLKPKVVKLDNPGTYGGNMKMFIGRTKDIRLMVVYGYARLVGYDKSLNLKPDLLLKVENIDNKIYTLYLRPGHKWSDGQPFTTEDFRYWWFDIANNEELSPAGPPAVMLSEGILPTVEIINETTIKYSWKKPNPSFLHNLAGASPLFIYRPAHYLKKFHKKYSNLSLEKKSKGDTKSWAAIHNKRDNLYKFDNPKLPTLQPWLSTTKPPATRFIFQKNPYFHKIDQNGLQLPYIDQVIFSQVSGSLISAKAGAGEADLQARNIGLQSFPFLKKGEERNGYYTYLWKEAKGSHLALFPNLNVKDPLIRKLFKNKIFRNALSISIDRQLINEALYFGLALESNNTVLPNSPLYKSEYQTKWTEFDIDKANKMLDEIGSIKRNNKGERFLEDGRRLEIIVETAGESEEETDILELIKDNWAEIGIKLFSKPSQRDVLRNRIFSGQTMMAVWSGLENGIANAEFEPNELAVTSQHQYQWPQWGQYVETKGRSGMAPDLEAVIKLDNLHKEWKKTTDKKYKEEIWHKMLNIHSDETFTIGIVSGVKQPIVVRKNLMNVPKDGIYNWNPGAHLGIYRPETFWYKK
ncbi:ABC transporter substrate-binding protein [Alphaproteobacteria bacterium]|nr:ABC transporter substrate-binding protein [Alphaproteobacteria bacterium]